MANPGRLAALIRGWIRAEAGMSRILLATLVALLTFTAALFGGFLHATNVADELTQANERRLVENQLDVMMRSLVAAESIQLTWDDAIRAAGGQGFAWNPAWADMYIGQFLTTKVSADELFLVTPQGELMRAWHEGRPASPAAFAPLATQTRRALAEMGANHAPQHGAAGARTLADTAWPQDARGRPLPRWTAGLTDYRGRPAVMTVISILPDTDYGLLRRTPNHVVALRYLDGAMLGEFAGQVMLGDMRYSRSAPQQGRRNSVALSAPDGQVLGFLSWQPNEVGPLLRRRTLPLLAGYLCFFVVVLVLGSLLVRSAFKVARELAASEAQAQHHALHDPMLGLPNRTHLLQRLAATLTEVSGGKGSGTNGSGAHDLLGKQVQVAYFDLDHFKAINESLGHHVGDDLLVQAVARLRERMQPGDLLGRLASDEFVLMRRTDTGREGADALGAELMAIFAEPFKVFGHSIPVTASCGISWAPEQAQDAKALLRNADIALFRAKQRGRARYRRFTRDMDATIRWRQDMEIELRRAISMNALSMVYQPIVHVGDGSISSFEALVRWTHRDRGEIGPGIFVPVAEQCGLMPQLGDWVLRKVFADSQAFGTAEISVNLSPLQLVARDFLPNLKALIREERVDPTRFTFEITEGVLLDRSERVMQLLNELQDMGFRIALDDFGTGYSSLAYLRTFQFDRIKIDRSFVQGIETDIDAQSILRAIVALGRTLRMKVVAEGVETQHQQQLVDAAGCQYVQGHFYWRALNYEQVIALLATDRVRNLRVAV
ncbi:bifunctional diguanylate cyclase/phosphodiesterase [Novosphingobium flavum]|uniref:Bifunctional diguanylate cyclase/phosphodiesterase n=1 Tax=Novosphingobium flavum TaxID=1778672 RepID=A0A7X1FS50_9SPHN|nr:bifunctional diguanylate cyclase/phosphodiesterase [Novosphingobium flavum]MBC2665975.1 bifunctional diguanylate cyclase/phosphodiesterase [Novosphingobium flavum]